MATPIEGPVSDREKQWIRDRLRRALDPRTFELNPPAGFPEQIAGPATGNPFKDFQRRVGRAACDRWARGSRPGIVPYRDSYYRELCDPYLGADLPGLPTTAPPFTGGQCQGTVYQFVITADPAVSGGLGAVNSNAKTIGPITSWRVATEGTRFKGYVTSRGSITAQSCGIGAGQLQPLQERVAFDVVARGQINAQFAILGTCNGGPDNCGDPTDVFNPGVPNPTADPNPGPVGGPTGYPFPDFDIDVNPDGTINFDFGDGSPPEVFDPADPGADGAGGAGGGAPTNPGSPGGTGATGDGGEEEGEAGAGEELTGVLVRVLSAPQGSNKFDNVSATVYRGVGYVAMGYPGLLGVDTSAAVVESPQFFHAQQRGLTAWRVRANVGFNLETTPYYRETEA